MAREILLKKQRLLLEEERQLAKELQACLQDFKKAEACTKVLQEIIASLDELFMLVVMGEFNTGKSALINALLNAEVVKEGLRPTTDKITVIRYDEHAKLQQIDQDAVEQYFPSDLLRNVSIVDTPGGNALEEHERIRDDFIPHSDLILFVMWAFKACTKSEQILLERIRSWRVDVVIILNGIDNIRSSQGLDEIIDAVQEFCINDLNFKPDIIPISALQAQEAQRLPVTDDNRETLWLKSRFEGLTRYLYNKLREAERVRTKLRRPLDIMRTLLAKAQSIVDEHTSMLTEDIFTINTLHEILQSYEQNIKRDLPDRLSKIEYILSETQRKSELFFDETIRLSHLPEMIRTGAFRNEFERKIVNESQKQIEEAISNLARWVAKEKHSLWQRMEEYLDRRRTVSIRRDKEILAATDSQVVDDKERILQALTENGKDVMKTHDLHAEAEKLSQNLHQIVIKVVSGGSLGIASPIIAAIITFASTTIGLPITGSIGGLMALGGFYFLIRAAPTERARVKVHVNQQLGDLREKLLQDLRKEIDRTINTNRQDMLNYLHPYVSSVHADREKIATIQRQLIVLNNKMAMLSVAIENLQ